MTNLEVLEGMFYCLLFLIACFVVPIQITKLWDRYVRGIKKDDTNSGAKFG